MSFSDKVMILFINLIEEYEKIEKSDTKGEIKIYGLRIDEKNFDG